MSTTTSGGNVFRRIIGITLLALGVLGVILSIVGILVGTQLIDGIGVAANDALSLAADGLNTTKGTLEQTKTTVQSVQTGIDDLETAIVTTGETVSQSDALVEQALKITSRDIPDTLDQVNAAIPGAAETAQTFLGNVETAMVDASQTINQSGPLLNQTLEIASQDVPDTLDAVYASVPAMAEDAHALLGDVEVIMVDASKSVDQADAALDQVITFTSRDVPDALDAVHAAVPATAEVAHAFLDNVVTTMVDASGMVNQADATLDQVVKITSHDVPDTIDAVNAAIPPTAEAAQTFLSDAETAMVNASEMVNQADATLDQAVKITSHDVPDTLDALNASIPATADAAQAFIGGVETTLDGASTTVDQTEAAMQLTSNLVGQQVPETLDQVNATLPPLMQATEGNINTTLGLLNQLGLLDGTYRVRVDEPADQLSTNLEYLSDQLREMEAVLDTDLGVVDEGISTMSQNLGLIDEQIDQLVAMGGQLEQVSDELRGLEALYNNSVDLETVSQDILTTSQNVAAINGQIDEFVVTAGQLEQVSEQLRGLEGLYEENVDLETVSKDIMTLSQDVTAIDTQIDEFVEVAGQLEVLSSQLRALEPYGDIGAEAISRDILALSRDVAAFDDQIDEFVAITGQLEVLSGQLRALEPYAQVDYETISQDVLALSKDMGAINQQIDEVVKITAQLEVLSSQLRALEPYADLDFEAIGQDIVRLSEDVGAINEQIDGFVTLTDQYIGFVDEINSAINQAQANLDRQLILAKIVIVVAMIWILLGQLVPLYLGWELVTGRRDDKPVSASTPSPEPELEPAA